MNNDKIYEHTKLLTGIELSKSQIEKIKTFEQLFLFYNAHTNLMSKNDEKFLYEKHIYDSFALSLFFQRYKIDANIKLLDIGTGGGFPSLPLSLIFPDMNIYPLDSIAKKIGFIEFIQKELRLENLNPICCRVEDLPSEYKSSFDIVTSRAVASLNTLLEYTIPFVKTGSYFVAFKSKNAESEIEEAQNAFVKLNCEIVDKIAYTLPTNEHFERLLLVIKKNKETKNIYPRKMGIAKKNPL